MDTEVQPQKKFEIEPAGPSDHQSDANHWAPAHGLRWQSKGYSTYTYSNLVEIQW